MGTGIDEKEFSKRIKKLPVRKKLGYGELAYARTDSGGVYSFCPLCGKIIVVKADQVEKETKDQVILKGTVSCDCRSRLSCLNKSFLRKVELSDGNLGLAGSFRYVVDRLFRGDFVEDPGKYYQETLDQIYSMIHAYRMEKKAGTDAGPGRRDGPGRKDGPGRREDGHIGAAAAGYAAVSHLADGGSDAYRDPGSYVPDDFEPDLDPYDRQALYDEEVIDDWILAGGGNPYDLGDRMEALSDPFGFCDGDSPD